MKSTAGFTANSHAANSPSQSSADQLGFLADWLRTDPEVPAGQWFKKFSGLTVCGEGEFIKTFLQPGQIATGEEWN
jgi:hypothetical protein